MPAENALADAVRFFHIDARSSSVGLTVDFDMALPVLASGLYRLMANRMRGYQDAQAGLVFRDLIDMPADISISQREVTVRPSPDRPCLRSLQQVGCGSVVEGNQAQICRIGGGHWPVLG